MASLLLDEIENFTNYESVLNSISDLICILDREHNVIFENHASIAMYGKNTGEKCYKAYGAQEDICDNCPTVKVFSNNGTTISEQKPYNAQGVQQYVEIVASPLFNKNGEIVASLEVVRDLTKKKQAEQEREELIKKLEAAASEIKILQGILPICSFCKKIRDDKGYWNQLEEYIRKHSEAEFTHGICSECVKKHYPECA